VPPCTAELASRGQGRAHARPTGLVLDGAGRGASPASLAQTRFHGAFYPCHGASGRRYVLSVFDRSDWTLVSDFDSVAIVGVANDGTSCRPICVLSPRELRALGPTLVEVAGEWHALFGADEAALKDLAGSVMNWGENLKHLGGPATGSTAFLFKSENYTKIQRLR